MGDQSGTGTGGNLCKKPYMPLNLNSSRISNELLMGP